MTISSSVRTAGPYNGNGVTVSFPFNFKVFEQGDLLVVLSDANGYETTLNLTSDYTVTLNPDQDSAPGGTVTTTSAPTTGSQLVITSDIEATQLVDIQNQSGFYPKVITGALDKLTALVQQMITGLGRSLKLPIADTYNTTLPGSEARKGMALVFASDTGAPALAPASVIAYAENLAASLEAKSGAEAAEAGALSAKSGAEAAEAGALSAKSGAEAAEAGALSAKSGAEAAEAGALSAKSGAEAARDAAQLSVGIYTTTAAGIAATVSGQYFSVPAALTYEYLILYLNSAGSAVEVKRYPSADRVKQLASLAGGPATGITYTIEGSTTPNTSSASTSFMWTNQVARSTDCLLTQVALRVSSAGGCKILVVDVHNAVLSETSVVTASGVNSYDLSPGVFVPAGARVWFLATTGALRYTTGGTSYSISVSEYSGVLGDKLVNATTQVNVNLALECTFSNISKTHESRINDMEDATGRQAVANVTISNGAVTPYFTTEQQSGTWAVGVPSIAYYEFAQDAGVDLIVGDVVTAVAANLIAASGTTRFRVKIYERATSNGDIQAVEGADVLLAKVSVSVSDLGLTPGASVTTAVRVPVTPFVVRASNTYHVILEAFTATGGLADFGIGNVTTAAETRQRRRGWIRSAASTTVNGVVATSRASTGLICSAVAPTRTVLERVIKGDISISGMTVTALVVFERNGIARTLSGTFAITPTTGLNVRYDIIYYDADSNSFGVVSGAERSVDPSEFIPDIGSSDRVALYNVRVTAGSVTAQAVWAVRHSEWYHLSIELEQERRRGRMCLRKTLAKIRRGANLKILSFGDSIVALQAGATPSSSAPNGPSRDLPYYYMESIGSDVTSAIPLYTALQLGRSDDGAGAVHHKVGFVWTLVNALDEAGYTLGGDLIYDNFGLASTSTASAWSGGAPTAWLSAAAALAPDLVVLNFGMNEYGSATTEANMASIVATFKAAGSEVIVMAPARKNATTHNAQNWRFTHQALHRAALYAGAAFVPTIHLYDDGYLGVIGCTPEDVCSANRNNHPGIREHTVIGNELIKLLM